MFVEHVDHDAAVVAAVDGGAEGSFRVFAYPAVEDDLDIVRSAELAWWTARAASSTVAEFLRITWRTVQAIRRSS